MPRLRDALLTAADRLAAAGVDSPRLSAEVLFARAVGGSRVTLLTDAARMLTTAELVRAEHFIARRERGEPVAYILGEKEFYGLDFRVTPGTLIPRPETEQLVELAEERFPLDAPLRFLDFGTGSGALAVAVAVRFPRARGVALDLSSGALEVARSNARRHGVEERVRFVEADFTAEPPLTGADLVVANPPYVSEAEYAGLDREVAAFEPRSALVSAEEGLAHLRGLLPRAAQALAPGGLLLVEIGCGQGAGALDLLRSCGGFEAGAVLPDLAGLDRVLRATRCG
ncbi:MAG: peptide chain release factor N(5)-glutamine methyltransferase [Desulfovibrionaceae bacterium]